MGKIIIDESSLKKEREGFTYIYNFYYFRNNTF